MPTKNRPSPYLFRSILVETLDGYEAWITGDLLPIVEESVTGVVDLTAILEEEHQMGLTKWGYLTRIEQPDEQDCFIAVSHRPTRVRNTWHTLFELTDHDTTSRIMHIPVL